KPVLSLLWRASQADQLGGDLRARAEGTQADIAARQLFRHHAHRSLAKSEPTVLFWYGEAKDTKLGQSLDHFQGNKIVCEMPLVSSFRVFVGKAPELLGDEGVGFVQSPLAKVAIETEFSDALPNGGTIAERDQAADFRGKKALDCLLLESKVLRAHDLHLAEGDAANDLGKIFSPARLKDQGFQFAEGAPCL